ncbi:MAG: Lrp/AsnC ligand binding domain-containing protein [Elusimicrobiota bacterium]|jgi:hypothetical protein
MIQADWKTGEAVWKKVQSWPQTIGSWVVTGNWGVVVWLDARSWRDLYDRVVEIRKMKGVKATSTHFVFKGMKADKWWWEAKAGAWVFLRSPHLNGEMSQLTKWPWVNSVTSVPGDWDYMMWAGGKDWDQVWSHVGQLNTAGWQTETMVPLRSWWNKSWKKDWWAMPV